MEKQTEITIRKYKRTDEKAVTRLLEGLKKHIVSVDTFDTEDMQKGYAEAGMKYTIGLVSKSKGAIYVAETEDGQLVGYIVAVPKTSDESGRLGTKKDVKYGEIFDLFVDKKYRTKKIGKELMNLAETFLKKKGCTDITLGVFSPNLIARKFYERLGYELYDITYIKKVK